MPWHGAAHLRLARASSASEVGKKTRRRGIKIKKNPQIERNVQHATRVICDWATGLLGYLAGVASAHEFVA